jgi:hypothetical protein
MWEVENREVLEGELAGYFGFWQFNFSPVMLTYTSTT